jgi:beta-lactamase regulating signal transducer with metallopeptidase domain
MAERLAAVDWGRAALLLWIVGAAALLIRLLAGVVRLAWIERRATELTDDEWVRLTDGLSRRLRVGRIVRLLREPAATVPMTWGLFHPVVLLPAESERWPDERRRVVLAHELAHVRRWDAATQWIAHVALALFWFNPLVWVAVRQLRQEREHACDDAVLEIGTRAADYASHLLDIVRSLGSTPGAAAGLAMARKSQFEGRLLAILDGAVRRNAASRAAGLATAAAALACLLPLAALRPAAVVARAPTLDLPGASALTASPLIATAATSNASEQTVTRTTTSESDASLEPAETPPAAVTTSSAPAAAFVDGQTTRERLVASVAGGDPELYADIIRAAAGIESAMDRRMVLSALLERRDLSYANLSAIIQATRTMDSDTERRIVISQAIGHPLFVATSSICPSFVESIGWFSSPTEQRIVLSSGLRARQWSTASQVALLRTLGRVESDTERRIILSEVAEHQRMNSEARAAYIAAAGQIESDSERGIALRELAVTREPAVPGPAATPARSETRTRASDSAPEARRGGESQWDSEIHLEIETDGRPREIRINSARVFFASARWDITRIGAGGHLLVEERVDGRLRRVRAVPGAGGQPAFTYTVDGQTRPFDAESRRWMNALIREFTTS